EGVELSDSLGEFRNRLHRSSAGADDPDPLAAQIDVVVPARSVERIALELLHAGDARQLRRGQDAVGQNDEARAHLVTAIGLDDPASRVLVPARRLNRSVKQAVIVEPEMLRHSLAVFEDLKARSEFHRWDVTGLIQQRQVAVGFDIAGDTGIAIPIPGAADVAAFLAETHIGKAGLAQLLPQQQSAESGADY